MCKNRLGYIFILPQTSRLDKQSFQDFHLRMTDKLSSKQCDYNSIINYAVDKLHDDGFGDFSPLLEYSFRVKIIKDIPGFIQDISTNVNSRQENKNIRILLSDKKTEKTDTVHINGATHTAFIIMNEETAAPLYNTFEHPNPPFFYQFVRNNDEAEIVARSVSLDSIMCHAIGMCDDNTIYTDKVGISKDKVLFYQSNYLINNMNKWFSGLSPVINEISNISSSFSMSHIQQPYASLFYPFIPLVWNHEKAKVIGESYAVLWEKFLLWYVQIHKRLVVLDKEVTNRDVYLAFSTVRNYAGQINMDKFASKIKKELTKEGKADGRKHQIFLVVLRHMPKNTRELLRLAPLFEKKNPNDLRQGEWTIVSANHIANFIRNNNLIIRNMFISCVCEDET